MSDKTTPASKNWASWVETIKGVFARNIVIAGEGSVGAAKDRSYEGTATTTQRFEWPAGKGPTAIDMRVYAATDLPTEEIRITFDPESAAVSDANIAQAGSPNTDMQNMDLQVQDGWVRKYFSHPLRYLDFKANTAAVSKFRVLGV